MARRTITVVLLVSLALTSVHLAEAQQPAKIPKIGFLSSGTASGSTSTFRNDVFRQQLRELGYVEGKNISFESRYGEDNFDRLTAIADELVRLKVDVLVINSTPAAWLPRLRSVKTSMPQTDRAGEQTRRVQAFAALDLIEY